METKASTHAFAGTNPILSAGGAVPKPGQGSAGGLVREKSRELQQEPKEAL